MPKLIRTDTTINISKEVKAALVAHLPLKIKIGPWTEEAIKEKIERERLHDVPTLERQEQK